MIYQLLNSIYFHYKNINSFFNFKYLILTVLLVLQVQTFYAQNAIASNTQDTFNTRILLVSSNKAILSSQIAGHVGAK